MKRKFLSLMLAFITVIAIIPFASPNSCVEAASGTDLYVGYSDKSNNFNTVYDALEYCKTISPSSEQERITINIAPGTYRRQLIITTPYITLKNAEPDKGDVILTWYYGIGYKYYSVGSDGYYNAANAAAKSAKTEPTTRWGCTVQLKSNAVSFMAENITFENSFNRYVTSEELADGVEPSGSQSITFDRTAANADVTSKAATERGAAIAIEANYAQFLNCTFLGSQDTFYTGDVTGYLKNCTISGNTDYIFGSGNFVFDACELNFYGYSSSAAGGYITAAREQTMGYLFKDCTVTANKSKVVSTGYFGRPWRDTAVVTFLNTKLESDYLINAAGWTSMSGVSPEQADFNEYNTTCNGTSVSTSSRVSGTVLSYSEASAISVANYLGSWSPTYMNASSSDDDDDDDEPDYSVSYVLNANDLALNSYSSDIYVNQAFTVKVNAADAVSVDSTTASSADGKYSFTKRIKLGGAGNTSNRSVEVTSPGSGTLSAYIMSSNSSAERSVALLDSSGNVLDTKTVTGAALNNYSFTIPSAGKYYITTISSGLYVFRCELNASSSQSQPEETTTETTTDSQTETESQTQTETTAPPPETSETETETEPVIVVNLYGDLNNDNVLNASDLTCLKKGILTEFGSAYSEAAADLNGNGYADYDDLLQLKKLILNSDS